MRLPLYISDVNTIDLSRIIGFDLEFWDVCRHRLILPAQIACLTCGFNVIVPIWPVHKCTSKQSGFYNPQMHIMYFLQESLPETLWDHDSVLQENDSIYNMQNVSVWKVQFDILRQFLACFRPSSLDYAS